MHITVRGRTVKVELNGELVLDADLDDYKASFAEHPGLQRAKGFVGLQSFAGGPVEFRNVRIAPLTSPDK